MYIGYNEIEELIELLPMLEKHRARAGMELKTFSTRHSDKDEDDYIYSLAVGIKNLTDMPLAPLGNNSSKTETAAMGFRSKMESEQKGIAKEIREEILLLRLVEDKLRLAIDSLDACQQAILKSFYEDKQPWKNVVYDVRGDYGYMTIRQAQFQRRQAIRKIVVIAKISQDEYRGIKKIVEI